MLKLSSGHSEKDRISFYSCDNCATAILCENGKINVEFSKKNVSTNKYILTFLGIFGILSFFKALVLIPLIKFNTIKKIWYLVPAFYYCVITLLGIIDIRKNGGQELLRNHGAEHKVFAAYKKLGRIPTFKEANKFSRINNSCGITIFSAFITSQILGFIVYINTSFIIPEILLFLIPLFFQKAFPFNFIGKIGQFFTTSKPQKQNIELAIVALSELERREFS